VAAEAPTEPRETADWPAVIARLEDELDARPFPQLQQQLAIAYNNYGVSLGERGEWDLAARQLQEAVRLDADNPQFLYNLSNAYLNQAYLAYQQHRLNDAAELLEQVIALNPKVAQAYVLLGEVEYGRQRLKEAKAAWARALALDPSQPELAHRLTQVTEELPVESKFERLSQAYFDLRYEEQLERPVGFDIRDALLDARRQVGSDFAYWPKYKLVVLVYGAASFRALRAQTPDWVSGQFDGKIRVPFPDGELAPSAVRRIIFHEYTHALVHDLARGRCPTWLNEGLAEYEGRTQESGPLSQLTRALEAGRLVPWTQLSDRFSFSLPADEVALAYEQSSSIVSYFVERYGFWRIRRVLKAVAEGSAWEAALVGEFRLKLVRLEANWREWLPDWLRSAHAR
jgi:tetratricopeptide (TPR) repeat protein